uniref:Uncharacterized protein n=1 Tax=Arundo donax TaxID=35708 RepID=A0A0A9FN83_ARUDO
MAMARFLASRGRIRGAAERQERVMSSGGKHAAAAKR